MELAAQKSEAMVLTNKYKIRNFKIAIEEEEIELKKSVKYLGVTIDKRLTFTKHISQVTEKAKKISNYLNRIMPRAHGAGEEKRRLLAKIAESIVTYGAPVWEEALKIKQNRKNIEKVQRVTALRVSRAYKTVSNEAVLVIGRCIPWQIKLDLRRAIRSENTDCGNFEEECIEIWQKEWSENNRAKGE